MTQLELWLERATRKLSRDSAAQVRAEISEHYEAAREAALSQGTAEADRMAIAALGDAGAANRQYRTVLLTRAEARMLRDAKWEGRAFCSVTGLKWMLLAIPVSALVAAAVLFGNGSTGMARVAFAGGIALGTVLAALFLPVYTPSRGRIFRAVKWTVLSAALVLAFGPMAFKWSWLLISCMWPMVHIEMTRVSIRRKLPVAQWPKALFL